MLNVPKGPAWSGQVRCLGWHSRPLLPAAATALLTATTTQRPLTRGSPTPTLFCRGLGWHFGHMRRLNLVPGTRGAPRRISQTPFLLFVGPAAAASSARSALDSRPAGVPVLLWPSEPHALGHLGATHVTPPPGPGQGLRRVSARSWPPGNRGSAVGPALPPGASPAWKENLIAIPHHPRLSPICPATSVPLFPTLTERGPPIGHLRSWTLLSRLWNVLETCCVHWW